MSTLYSHLTQQHSMHYTHTVEDLTVSPRTEDISIFFYHSAICKEKYECIYTTIIYFYI